MTPAPIESLPIIRSVRLAPVAMLLLGLAAQAGELVADRDSYVFGGDKPSDERTEIAGYASNFGQRTLLELKTTVTKPDGFTRKIYLGFNLASLPRSVDAISLRLNLREMNPGPGGDKVLTPQPIKLYLLKPDVGGDDWREGAGLSGAQTESGVDAGSLHWLNAPANYRQSGDRFTKSSVIEAGAIELPIVVEKNREVLIPLSPAAVKSLTQGGHGPRATFMLSVAEGTDDLMRFHSREAGKPAYRPALVW